MTSSGRDYNMMAKEFVEIANEQSEAIRQLKHELQELKDLKIGNTGFIPEAATDEERARWSDSAATRGRLTLHLRQWHKIKEMEKFITDLEEEREANEQTIYKLEDRLGAIELLVRELTFEVGGC